MAPTPKGPIMMTQSLLPKYPPRGTMPQLKTDSGCHVQKKALRNTEQSDHVLILWSFLQRIKFGQTHLGKTEGSAFVFFNFLRNLNILHVLITDHFSEVFIFDVYSVQQRINWHIAYLNFLATLYIAAALALYFPVIRQDNTVIFSCEVPTRHKS